MQHDDCRRRYTIIAKQHKCSVKISLASFAKVVLRLAKASFKHFVSIFYGERNVHFRFNMLLVYLPCTLFV